MPTLGDLLTWAVKTFGEGVLHKNAQATRGGDYLQREEAQQNSAVDAQTRRAITLGGVERERLKTAGAASQARSEFPELEGAGDEEAAVRLDLMRGSKDRELTEALKLAQVDTEVAQQEELGKRHQPRPLNEEERQLLDMRAESEMAQAEKDRSIADFNQRRPSVTPPRPRQPRETTGLDLAKLRLQAERAGLTVEEMADLLETAGGGGVDTTPTKGPETADVAPKGGQAGGEVASRQQFDALPVGSRFTKGGRPCVKVNASQMDCR